MLDVAPTELLLVAVVAVVVIGPKDLPKAMRVVGHWTGKARGVARQFRAGFDEMVREAELADLEKKWAEDNARIMREHPDVPPVTAAADRDDGDTAACAVQPDLKDDPVADSAPVEIATTKPKAKPKAKQRKTPAKRPASKPGAAK